ncbi:MAG TPA: hypothetical protein PL193_10215 [Xanthobacteraceae bacterium]|nr:hypothetical protein [Xanthobacteraceae bacterium]
MNATPANTQSPPAAPGIFLPLHPLLLLLICASAFAVYWHTSFMIVARDTSTMFGADTWFYTELADGHIIARLRSDYFLDRIFRFHPLTVFLAAGWLKLLSPLTAWFAPEELLRAMFALTGALGVWAAISAFATLLPRMQAALWGVIYAASLNIWYFSSIEESKILSATLATIYIAGWLHLRVNPSRRGFLFLSAILLLACLNEIVAAFMVAVPAVDIFLRKGWNWRELRWLFPHALMAPLAYLLTQLLIYIFTSSTTPHAEGANHLDTLLWYIAQNSFSLESLHAFAVRWLFFSIAAPEPNIYFANPAIQYGGDFFPALWLYFVNPLPAIVALMAAGIFIACFWREPDAARTPLSPILLGLAAYALVRGVFFFFFIPKEYLLYSPSVTLAHLLLIAVPFARSRLPGKPYVIAGFAAALIASNAIFLWTVKAYG